IAVTIPRGQRLSASPLEVRLGGEIPSGLATGDLWIEVLADATGQLHRAGDTSPIQLDLTLDLGLFATDPIGNAVLAQTVLGVRLAGVAVIDDGVLSLE